MKYLLILTLLLPFQQDADHDADGHLKVEHQIPEGHYCMNHQVYDENVARLKARGVVGMKGAHPCDCTYACSVDANGNITETGGEKGTSCKSYCSKDGRKCTCHVEEPCDQGHHIARMDMNHQMISVTK